MSLSTASLPEPESTEVVDLAAGRLGVSDSAERDDVSGADREPAADSFELSDAAAWPSVSGSGVSESGVSGSGFAAGSVVPAPPGTRTWTDGPDPVTARCRTRGPAVDFDDPADAVDLSVDDEPVSASSAEATPEVAVKANPIPSANAAEPTRTPNPAESMTPPSRSDCYANGSSIHPEVAACVAITRKFGEIFADGVKVPLQKGFCS